MMGTNSTRKIQAAIFTVKEHLHSLPEATDSLVMVSLSLKISSILTILTLLSFC